MNVITLHYRWQDAIRIGPVFLTAIFGLSVVGAAEQDDPDIEEVVTYGQRVESGAEIGPNSSLTGDVLSRQLDTTLGGTLDEELGVHNASFGPGVGLPVVRGLSGSRVKMLHNGLGSHDASASSPDHAVAVEPMLAEEIRVVRGADVVRYGGGAMGGAVEVIDGRIPRQPTERLVEGAIEARTGTNPTGHNAAFKLDVGYDYLGFHIDGFDRRSGNVDIPGAALDEPAVRQLFGEFVEFENNVGTLPNSNAEAQGGAVGASIVGAEGFIGGSISSLSNDYGIPPGGLPPHSDIPGQAPELQRIRIDVEHGRRDLQAEWRPEGRYLDHLSAQIGHVRYRHHESDNARVSTTFRNEAIEGRGEVGLRYSDWASGVFGGQWVDRSFGARGFETFVPESAVDTVGIYTVQRLDFERFDLEFGFRRETSYTRPSEREQNIGGVISVTLPAELDYTAYAGSFAVGVAVTDSLSVRAAYNYTQRPPDVQELLSLGPHLSTRSFAIGNTELEVETARAAELGFVLELPLLLVESDIYYRDIGNFIYQENLGLLFDIEEQLFKRECVRIDQCVAAFGYLQQDARFLGFESRITVPLTTRFGIFRAVAFADSVRGYFVEDGAGSVPRLPPATYGAALEYEAGGVFGKLRAARSMDQSRSGLNEPPTAGYTMLNAELSYRFAATSSTEAFAFIRARNLLDDDVRNATSFLRAFVPEPGRTIDAAIRFEF